MLLSENNIKAELSYAYLYAVAVRAGFACEAGNRHEDGIGVDAKLRIRERLEDNSVLTDFTIDIQLKSTSVTPGEANERYSHKLPIKNYNELRSVECAAAQLLIVLYLPNDDSQWLTHSVEKLVFKKCAFWLSLCGAPASDNETSQTVYIPKENWLSVESLRSLATQFSRREVIEYDIG